VFQRFDESLKDYTERFRCEVNKVENLLDESILTTIFVGLQKDRKLYENIYKSLMRDLGEFYEQAAKEIKWEEAFVSEKPNDQKKEVEGTSQNKKIGNNDSYKVDQG